MQNETRSMRKRTVANIVSFILITAFMVAIIIVLRGALLEQTNETYSLLVENYAGQENSRLQFYESILDLSTNYVSEERRDGVDPEQIESTLFKFLSGYNDIYAGTTVSCFGLIDGKFITNEDRLVREEPPDGYENEDWYVIAQEGDGDIAFYGPYEDSDSGEVCVTLVQKISGTDDILALNILINARPGDLEKEGLPEESSYYFCDTFGDLIYRDSRFPLTDQEAQDRIAKIISEVPEDAQSYRLENLRVVPGSVRNAYVARLDNYWYVVLTVPASTIESELVPFYFLTGAFVVVWVAAAVSSAVRGYRREKRSQDLIKERDFVIHDREIIEKTTESTLGSYRELLYIDLDNDRLQTVYSVDRRDRRSAIYSTAVQRYLSYGKIEPQDKARFEKTLSIENLRRELLRNDMFELHPPVQRRPHAAQGRAYGATGIAGQKRVPSQREPKMPHSRILAFPHSPLMLLYRIGTSLSIL